MLQSYYFRLIDILFLTKSNFIRSESSLFHRRVRERYVLTNLISLLTVILILQLWIGLSKVYFFTSLSLMISATLVNIT